MKYVFISPLKIAHKHFNVLTPSTFVAIYAKTYFLPIVQSDIDTLT